jgi:hypothetical protein
MTNPLRATEQIAKSSVEEGLDFACNLLMSSLATGEEQPQMAQQLLKELAHYITLRYAGELLLALEYLAGLAHLCTSSPIIKAQQFWSQLQLDRV